MRKSKLVCTVLALVFVGSIAIGDREEGIYASESPTLGAIAAGSAMVVEVGEPMVWWPGWNNFFAAVGAVLVAVERIGDWAEWWDNGGTHGANMDYSGVSEAIFD